MNTRCEGMANSWEWKPVADDQNGTAEGVEHQRNDVHLRSAFHQSVEEGFARLHRSWPGLLATGFVGGLDVSMGVLAHLVVQEATGSAMLGSLAFAIGFIMMALGKSELFTENFLVPVAAVTAGKAGIARLLRLWAGTLAMNLLGGWVAGWLIVIGLPHVADTAVELGSIFADLSLPEALALGVLGGVAITMMTWIEHGSRSDISRLVSVTAIAFLLAAAHLNHVIVVSIEMFVALHTGAAPFNYGDWIRVASVSMVTNMVGGLVLVTVLRLVQVGARPIEEERQRPVNRELRELEEN